MQTEYLKYLCEIAQCGSLNKAAQKLYMTQPALNAAMNALEKELGFAILNRSSKGVTLTPAGTKIIQDTTMILDTIKNWQALAQPTDPICQNITVIAFGTINTCILPNVMTFLHNNYHSLNLSIYYQPQAIKALDSLCNEKARIGIIGFSDFAEEKTLSYIQKHDFQAQLLLTDHYHVAFHSGHPLETVSVITLDAIKDFPLVFYSSDDLFDKHYQNHLLSNTTTTQHYSFGTNESIINFLKQNEAISFFPEMFINCTHAFQSRELLHLPIHDCPMQIKHYLVYPTTSHLTPMDQVVLKAIEDEYTVYEQRFCL